MTQTVVQIIAVLLTLVGLVLVPFSLPGTWLIVLTSVLYSIFYPFGAGESPLFVNALLIAIAIFGEIVEFAVGTFGGKTFKVSNGAIISAFVGGIVGAIIASPIFLIGALLGLFIGAFLGAFIYELIYLKSFSRALVNALAVLASRVVASFLKTSLALVMAFYFIFKIF